jgi:internalin A
MTSTSFAFLSAGLFLSVAAVACGGKSNHSKGTEPTGGTHTGGSGENDSGGAGHGTGAVSTGGRGSGGSNEGTGAVAAGGRPAGGNDSGGTHTGGTNTGGTNTGGASTGGTGGSATGGASAGGTGGSATGGAAAGGTGGSATGGAATGGTGGTGGAATGGSGGEPSWICGDSRCVPGASCDPDTGFCECDQGYEGDGWWCLSTAPCDDSPCLNGGTCHPSGTDHVLCTCPANWGGVHCESSCSGVLSFPDPALAAAVRQAAALGDNEPITAEAAASINDLGIYDPISDFTGLECLTSVSWVSIEDAALTDLSPFAALPRLSHLYAPCNPLVDLSSVASLINLTSLSLGQDSSCDDETGVTDIGPLAGLVGLVDLDLSGHNIQSLAPLSQLTRLEWLVLASNANLSSLADLKPLSRLNYLVVTDTQVSDLAPLAGHSALETLWLSGSMVADLTPLLGITSLKNLYIVATPVDCAAQADNLAALKANGVDVTSSCG